MGCTGTCERIEFEVRSSKFLRIEPQPDADAARDLERRMLEIAKHELATSSHDCGDGCDCVSGEPVLVSSREQIKRVRLDGYEAWFQVTLAKYRTPGECMPAADTLPDTTSPR